MEKETNIIDTRKAEILYSIRSKKLEELRELVESGNGSIVEIIKCQILQERMREDKARRE